MVSCFCLFVQELIIVYCECAVLGARFPNSVQRQWVVVQDISAAP